MLLPWPFRPFPQKVCLQITLATQEIEVTLDKTMGTLATLESFQTMVEVLQLVILTKDEKMAKKKINSTASCVASLDI